MSSWKVPQFVYNGNTWTPTYPATNREPQATLGLDGVTHSSITSSGLQQTVNERVDQVTTLDFPAVPQSDLANWQAFLLWACAGKPFTYAEDSTQPGTLINCLLTEYTVPFKRVGFELFSLTLKIRVQVTAQIGS